MERASMWWRGPRRRSVAKCSERDIDDLQGYRPVANAGLKEPNVMRDDQSVATADKAI